MTLFPFADRSIRPLIEKFGGWQKILDPEYLLPEEVYIGLSEAGYTREQIDRIRKKQGRPERDAWIHTISKDFYNWWRASYQMMDGKTMTFWPGYPGINDDVRWQDYPNPNNWKNYEDVMTRLSIRKDDIDAYITEHTDYFPPLKGGQRLPW